MRTVYREDSVISTCAACRQPYVWDAVGVAEECACGANAINPLATAEGTEGENDGEA